MKALILRLSSGFVLPALMLLFLATPACSTPSAEYFNSTASDEDSKPDEILEALAIQPGSTVADLGAGGGFFAFEFAKATGATGVVYAIDINPDYLEYIKKNAEEKGLTQIKTVQAEPDSMPLPKGSVDLLFTRNVYHHLMGRTEYFKDLKKILKPGARVAIIDYKPEAMNLAMKSHATDPNVIKEEMKQAGFKLIKEHDFLERQSFLIFQTGP